MAQMPGMVTKMAGGQGPKQPENWDRLTGSEKYDWQNKNLGEYKPPAAETYYDDESGGTRSAQVNPIDPTRMLAPSAPDRQRDAQLAQARDFRANIPVFQSQMADSLNEQASNAQNHALQATDQNYSRRGLLYSGMNERGKMGVRAQTGQAVASGIGGINADLENAAGQMDANAVQAGMQQQQHQQQIQNDIYARAMARMNSSNSIMGSAIGLAGTAGLLYATGGLSGGAALGVGGAGAAAGLLMR